MKRVLTLILFFAVFALINGPPVYSMTDVDEPISIETTTDLMIQDATDIEIQHVCILPGGLELKLPTQELDTYYEISETNWICSQLEDYLKSTTETTRLNDRSPAMKALLAQHLFMGLSRLDIGENYVIQHSWKTYI